MLAKHQFADDKVLFGNSFPWVLIRRRTTCFPRSLKQFVHACEQRSPLSFWGHPNSWALVRASLPQLKLAQEPPERVSLGLDDEGFIQFKNLRFRDCWILSASSTTLERRGEGALLEAEAITRFHFTQIIWD